VAFTYFFRDAQALELAIADALPHLCGRAFIHIWDAGCAHGPEPYTLAILLREQMSDYVFRNVRIHATDLDAGFGSQVASGVFPEQEVQRVPPTIVEKYFRPASQPGFVEVVPELRSKIAFSACNLLTLRPVREGLSMIVCKNVLLHFAEAQRVAVLKMFHAALQPEGTLVMEHTQKVPESLAPFFRQVTPCAQVYRKVQWSFVEHPVEDDPARRHGVRRSDVPVRTPSVVAVVRPAHWFGR
jgi:chemotaxis protein methyltransferase CheR